MTRANSTILRNMASTERRMGGMGYPTRKQSGDKGTRRQDGGTPDLIYASPALVR